MTLDQAKEEFQATLIKSIQVGEVLMVDGFEEFVAWKDPEWEQHCIELLKAVRSFAELEALKTRYREVMEGLIEAECLREVGGLQ
jgi:hypothetical protein